METNARSKRSDEQYRNEDQIRLGSLISDLSARFISPRSLDWEIDSALERIVTHLGADRGGVAQFDLEDRSLLPTHNYVRPGAPPILQVDLATELPWYTAEIKAGNVKVFPHLPDGLPPEAEAERHNVRLRGMKSHVLLPLKADGKTIGSLGLACYREYRDWSPQIPFLKELATILGHALARDRSDKILRDAYTQVQTRFHSQTAEFLQTYQALREFTLLASHDLQEPLRKIALFIGKFMDVYAPTLDKDGLDMMKRAQHATKRMQDMLTGLLDYSIASYGKPEPFSAVELTSLVREVIEDLETRVQETNGRIDLEELPTVKANRHQMHQLFQNLIGNALKFHREEKPVIKISSRISEDNVLHTIVVEDNGIGFEEKDAETIFTPFKRLHGLNSPYRGSGIGLSICQRIVERHGGTIIAKSTPGKGSTFIINLPIDHPK